MARRHRVKTHVRKDGTRVVGHSRSAAPSVRKPDAKISDIAAKKAMQAALDEEMTATTSGSRTREEGSHKEPYHMSESDRSLVNDCAEYINTHLKKMVEDQQTFNGRLMTRTDTDEWRERAAQSINSTIERLLYLDKTGKGRAKSERERELAGRLHEDPELRREVLPYSTKFHEFMVIPASLEPYRRGRY